MHNACVPANHLDPTIARAAAHARQIGLGQASIAKALGASQSQVSRVFSGNTSARSRLARDICSYVLGSPSKNTRDAVRANDQLIDALAEVWDGTPAHARALAMVIRSLALLVPSRHQEETTS